jgi:hypothetical protein
MAKKARSTESTGRGGPSSKPPPPKSAIKRRSASAPAPSPKSSNAPPAKNASKPEAATKPQVFAALPPAAKPAVATKDFVKVEITVTFTPGNENGIPEIKIFAYPTSEPDPSYSAQGDNDEATPVLLDVLKRITCGYPVKKDAVTLGVSGTRDLVVGPS